MPVRVKSAGNRPSESTSLDMVASLLDVRRKIALFANKVFIVKGVAALRLVSVSAVGHLQIANVSFCVLSQNVN